MKMMSLPLRRILSVVARSGIMWLVVILFAAFLILCLPQRPKDFPPGPRCLPIFGNLLSMALQLRRLSHHEVLSLWARRYGDVYGLVLGCVNVVVVSGKDKIREVCSREVFDGRPDGFFYTIRSFGKKLGLVFVDGPTWKTTRRLMLKYLKTFGYGSSRMEAVIRAECDAVLRALAVRAGRAVHVNDMFDVAVLNVLWQLVAGQRYDHQDPVARRLCARIKRAFKVVDMSGGVLTFLPALRHVAPGLTGYRELTELHDEIYAFIKRTIDSHRSTLDVAAPRDVIDVLLTEMQEKNDNALSEQDLQVVCLDLLEAGMETVSNTCGFLLLHVLRDPHVQHAVQQEIDAVCVDQPPAVEHRCRMVYTEAVVLEALRMSTVAPSGIPHMALEDAKLGNFLIPKGTHLILNLHELHTGAQWVQPDSFRPERFVSRQGTLMYDEKLMPFGTGRRRCIGENLARCELFLFLTHILQKFYMRIPEGDPMPSTEPINGVSLSAQPFRVVFERRVKIIC